MTVSFTPEYQTHIGNEIHRGFLHAKRNEFTREYLEQKGVIGNLLMNLESILSKKDESYPMKEHLEYVAELVGSLDCHLQTLGVINQVQGVEPERDSGLWHQGQCRGQPLRKTVVRIPGPSCSENR